MANTNGSKNNNNGTVNPVTNPPIQLALRTRVNIMAALIYSATDGMTVENAAKAAIELEHACDAALKATRQPQVD